jgi:iron complex outermembrane recepter protein
MRNKFLIAVMVFSSAVYADGPSINLNDIPVSANPLGLSNDELVRPTYIMNGITLQNSKDPSLGNMLDKVSGISNSSWGLNVGRPSIRGMDRNRVKILNNGMEIRDVSNVSGDHAIGLDSLATEQIEVIKGPETIIYGGGAIGGVINLIDYRIHPEFVEGVVGNYNVSAGGPNNAKSGSVLLDVGEGNIMYHVDLYDRDSKNLKIPGFSVSKRLADSDSEFTRSKYGNGTLQNSYNETRGGGVGTTYFFDKGYSGFSFAKHEQEYGTILEDGAYIDLESDNLKYVFEKRDLSNLIQKFKFKLSHTDYQHLEIEGDGSTGLDYFDKGADAKFQLVHSLFSPSGGVAGLDIGSFRFSQETSAYEPNNKRQNVAVYALESFEVGDHKINFGLRHDYHEYDANSFTSDDGAATEGGDETETSFNATEKTFNATSISLGTTSKLNQNWTLGASIAHTQRAPFHDELFVYGEHHATETIEHGDRNLKDERSNSIDLTLSWANEGNAFSITPYFTDFGSYIALLNTGVVQYHEHDGEEEALPVLLHQNVSAEFYGFEFQGNIDLSANYGLYYWGDYVRAEDKNGGDLPRIPPLSLGSGLSYEWNTLQANIDVEHTFNQTKIGDLELKTDDFTNVSFTVNYQLPANKNLNFYIKGDNLLDQERRDHVSFLKDKVLMGERSFMLGVGGNF